MSENKKPFLKRLMKIFLIIAAIIVLLPIIGLAVLSWTAKAPQNLGLSETGLAACPKSPNCVCSQTDKEADAKHFIDAFPVKEDAAATLAALLNAIKQLPRTKIVTQDNNYIHAECTSAIFRYVDDLEFWIDEQNNVVHVRSASRAGESDLGVNRKRVEQLRQIYSGSEANSS